MYVQCAVVMPLLYLYSMYENTYICSSMFVVYLSILKIVPFLVWSSTLNTLKVQLLYYFCITKVQFLTLFKSTYMFARGYLLSL